MAIELDALATQLRTTFVLDASGRIERENDPDRSPGPRFWLAGCASGNVVGVRADVPEAAAVEVLALAATEAPFHAPGARPRHFDRYVELLSHRGRAPEPEFGLLYSFPHGVTHASAVALVDSESDEGERLLETLARDGMPEGLRAMGFGDVSEFWAPWCVALHEGQAVSVAFAARLSEGGAEIGVATATAWRGRGYATAAAARWSALPSLRSRRLFYGTTQANASSQRVAARLGLRPLGANLRLG